MLTGFNTDIQHDGRVFHVQTEDKGLDNPVVESLIYMGGEILASRRQPYQVEVGQDALADLLERQHRTVVRDIRLGKYDPPEARRPFGEGIITERSLDEVVREFIESAPEGSLPPAAEKGK